MSTVDLNTATEEVDKWLDFKKVSQRKRDSKKEHIEELVDAVVDGTLILDENFSWTHNLRFPIRTQEDNQESAPIETFTYKPRVDIGSVQNYLKRISGSDFDGRVVCYVAALTSRATEMIKRLDTEDYSIAQAIAVFFI